MIKNLPTYKIVVNPDDNTGVFAVSMVTEGAIEVDFIKLAKELVSFEFTANKDKQLLYGPLLIPNKLIFRRDDKGNEYNIVFDEETIQIIADKYNQNKLGDVFNFQHSDKKVEAVMLENWLTGGIDKSQEFGFELPKGTWFAKVKVNDEAFWLSEIKANKINGFSVELKADVELVQLNITENKTINFMKETTKDGVELNVTEMIVGGEVTLADGTPVTAGDYELEGGKVITCDENGVITNITEMAPESTEETELAPELAPETTPELAPVVDNQAIMDVVSPMFEEMRAVMAEMMTKIAELEAKIGESNDSVNENMSAITERIELMAKNVPVQSVTVKNDAKSRKDELLLTKINAFSRR